MQIKTRDFGTVDVEDRQLVKFLSPVFGYEELTQYALLSDGESGGLQWLQSTDRPEVCFILLDPQEIGLPYAPDIGEDAARLLALDAAPDYRLVAVVPDDFKDTTVNLKSPIVLNARRGTAAQVILEADLPIRMRLFQTAGEEGLFVRQEEE